MTVGTNLKGETGLYLDWNVGNDIGAAALALNLEELYREAIAQVREKAYNAGWKDAKAKRGKQDWFSRCIGG